MYGPHRGYGGYYAPEPYGYGVGLAQAEPAPIPFGSYPSTIPDRRPASARPFWTAGENGLTIKMRVGQIIGLDLSDFFPQGGVRVELATPDGRGRVSWDAGPQALHWFGTGATPSSFLFQALRPGQDTILLVVSARHMYSTSEMAAMTCDPPPCPTSRVESLVVYKLIVNVTP